MTTLDDSIFDSMTPLYRAMGGAVHASQGFEYNLSFLLALITGHRRPTEPEIFSASLDLHATQTLGKLIGELRRELSDLPAEIEGYLKEGLEIRNRLVHGFFPKNTDKLMTPKGRLEIENELKVMTIEIQHRAKIVWSLIEKYLRKHGLATDELGKQFDDLWRALRFETQDDQPPRKH